MLPLVFVICAFALISFSMAPLIEASGSKVLVDEPTILSVNPQRIHEPSMTPGTLFTVDINVMNVTDLYTWAFILSWEPSVLNVTDVDEGPFLLDVAPEGTFFIDHRYQEAGYIDEADSILGPYYGADGSGTLLTVTFLVEKTAETKLEITSTRLINHLIQDIPHTINDGYFSNLAISVYTDKPSYSAGDTMHLGLAVINPLNRAVTVSIAVWLEKPDSSKTLVASADSVTLPMGFKYDNWNFKSWVLPSAQAGTYKWHAAILNPTTHAILVESISEWEFV